MCRLEVRKEKTNFNPNSFLPSRWSLCVYQQAEKSKPIGTNVHRSRRRLTVGSIFRRVSILSKDFLHAYLLSESWSMYQSEVFLMSKSCICLTFLPFFHRVLHFFLSDVRFSENGRSQSCWDQDSIRLKTVAKE